MVLDERPPLVLYSIIIPNLYRTRPHFILRTLTWVLLSNYTSSISRGGEAEMSPKHTSPMTQALYGWRGTVKLHPPLPPNTLRGGLGHILRTHSHEGFSQIAHQYKDATCPPYVRGRLWGGPNPPITYPALRVWRLAGHFGKSRVSR